MVDPSELLFVFVHGGQHTSACWRSSIDAMRSMSPETRTLAVDLPGRQGEPGDLSSLTIGECVQSVVRQIEHEGMRRVVLVGHSLAGITLPGVVTALGSDRVVQAVYLACCVPPDGETVTSTLQPPVRWIAKAMSRRGKASRTLPAPIATWMFANGMPKRLQREVTAGLVPESSTVTNEPVDRSDMPDVPTTWIVTLRDRSLKPRLQHQFIANLGTVDQVLEIDTCHNAMMSEPELFASLLLSLPLG